MPNGEGMGGRTTLPAPEEIAAAWAIHPAFVSHSGHDTEAAYAFAVARPDILEWMPCYCGCAALDQLRDLREDGADGEADARAGRALLQMRSAVDAAYGGLGVPGTPTELPPG